MLKLRNSFRILIALQMRRNSIEQPHLAVNSDEACYSKPFVQLEDKKEFFQCICLHYAVLASISEINQFIEGLKTCSVLSLILENPAIFRKVLQVCRQLTAEQVDECFKPDFSPSGSNRFTIEQNIVFNFTQYLEDIEQGKITTQVWMWLLT